MGRIRGLSVGLAILVGLSCGPYSHISKETVRIDLDSAVVTYTFEDVRPMYADSVEEGWEELMSIISDTSHVDSSHGHLTTIGTADLQVIDGKQLNVVLRYEIRNDSTGRPTKGLSWHEAARVQQNMLVENGEVLLAAKPTVFDCPGETECRFETTQRIVATENNRLVVFPTSTRRVEYSFVYSFPRSGASYKELYNREREKQGWATAW
ncbi:MAG: hypothetical protein GF331_13370 [Chitinivibrionales bacterium]|nr:hypothetical protein [Chitinivibrionales bacterium]